MNSMPKVDPTATLDPLHLINDLPPMDDGSSIEIHTGCPDPFAFWTLNPCTRACSFRKMAILQLCSKSWPLDQELRSEVLAKCQQPSPTTHQQIWSCPEAALQVSRFTCTGTHYLNCPLSNYQKAGAASCNAKPACNERQHHGMRTA